MTIDPAIASLSPPATLSIELREGLPFFNEYNFQAGRDDTTPVNFTGVESATCIVVNARTGETVAVGTAGPVEGNPGETSGFTVAFSGAETAKVRSCCLATPRTTAQPQEAGRVQVFFHDSDNRYMIIDGPCYLRFAGND